VQGRNGKWCWAYGAPTSQGYYLKKKGVKPNMIAMFVIGLVILGLAGIAFFAKATLEKREEKVQAKYLSIGLSTLASILIVLSLILGSLVTIPAGHRGVVLQFSGVTGKVMDEGLNWKVPFIQSIKTLEVRTQKYEVQASAASQDLQIASTTVALNFRLRPEAAADVYKKLGVDYIARVVDPAIHEVVKQIAATFIAEDLILKRPMVKSQIEESLTQRLTPLGMDVEALSLTDFKFSDTFTEAIEAKVVAVQAILEAENKLERVKVEAQQAEAKAQGEADARIKQAQGEAQYIETVTAAQVAANEAISATLTPEILQYILLDRLGDNIQLMVIPSTDLGLVLPQMLP